MSQLLNPVHRFHPLKLKPCGLQTFEHLVPAGRHVWVDDMVDLRTLVLCLDTNDNVRDSAAGKIYREPRWVLGGINSDSAGSLI